MKRAILSALAAFAVGVAAAGTQVTARQLTNAVNYAIGVASNYTDAAVAGAVDYTTVSNIVNDAVEVSEERTDGAFESLIEGGGAIVKTPKMQWDATRSKAFIELPTYEDGRVTNRTYYLDVTVNTTTGTVAGLLVASSNAQSIPEGRIYGITGDNTFASDGGTNTLRVWKESFTAGSTALYDVYVVSNRSVVTGPGVSNVTEITGRGWGKTLNCKEIRSTITTNGTTTTASTFTLTGFLITPATHKQATGLQTPPAIENPFSSASGMRETKTTFTFQQEGSGQVVRRVRRFSLLDLFVGSAYADTPDENTTVNEIPILPFPNAPMVDPWTYAERYGATKETHWCDCDAVYDEAAYNDPKNWFASLPVQAVVLVRQPPSRKYPEGRTIETTMEMELDEILKLMTVPPRPWPGPHFYEKGTQCEDGHIFVNCHCKYHPDVERDHDYEKEDDEHCAKCQNFNDKEKYDSKNGIYVKDGVSNVKCDYGTTAAHPCDLDDEDYHGGWSATHADHDYACVCVCGFYGDNHPHKYVGDQYTPWQKEDEEGIVDGINHWAYLTCNRCEDEKKWKNEAHTKKATVPLVKSTYLSPDTHSIMGECETCDWEGYITEGHRWQGASGESQCYCTTCEQYCHKWASTGCGKYQNSYCSRCQKAQDPVAEQEHDFSIPVPASGDNAATKHFCACGKESHFHYFENGKCVGGAPTSTSGTADLYKDDPGCGMKGGKKGHACPIGGLTGKGDNHPSHIGRDGSDPIKGSSGAGGCPCGACIADIYPAYNGNMPAGGVVTSKTSQNGVCAYAIGNTTGNAVVSWLNQRIENDLYAFASTGDTVNWYLKANGTQSIIYNSYLDMTITNMVYAIIMERSGTVKHDGTMYYIEWR